MKNKAAGKATTPRNPQQKSPEPQPAKAAPSKQIKFEEGKKGQSVDKRNPAMAKTGPTKATPILDTKDQFPDIKNVKQTQGLGPSTMPAKKDPTMFSSASVDRLGTAATSKGMMTTTGMSFRPSTQMSMGVLSCTSSNNLVPFLKSTYLKDYEKTYQTLDFGVAGRKGITLENKAIASSQKYRATIVQSYDATAKLLSRVRTSINSDVVDQYTTLDEGYRNGKQVMQNFKTSVDLLKIDIQSTRVACHQNLKEIEHHFPTEYDKLRFHLLKEVRNQNDESWKLKGQLYHLKKERDALMGEIHECADRISLLEKIVGYKLKKRILS